MPKYERFFDDAQLIVIGDTISTLRNKYHLRQSDVAEMLNIDQSSVAAFEAGNRPLSPELAVKILYALAMDDKDFDAMTHLKEIMPDISGEITFLELIDTHGVDTLRDHMTWLTTMTGKSVKGLKARLNDFS